MSLDEELKELKMYVERQITNSQLEACVRAMVRVKIKRSKHKQLVACFQFPDEYPKEIAMVEIRSRYISEKLTNGLSRLCEEELKKYIGKPQVLRAVHFVSNFIDENPLCCCSEEISNVKKLLRKGKDEIKLRQKSSSIYLTIREATYYIKYDISIPHTYPDAKLSIKEKEGNFPPVIQRWLMAKSVEIARQCFEPPAKKKPKDLPFEIKPSLQPVVSFLLAEAHLYPQMKCKVCDRTVLPNDAKDLKTDSLDDDYAERCYCGHLYHYKCLDTYIRTPPFVGGKKCHTCKNRIYHDRWKLTPTVAEGRWAHKQAKQRELDEVVDFLS